VEFDWRTMETARIASFMTKDEARQLLSDGIDIQLHTHRHRFPESPVEALRGEIADNSRVLGEITRASLVHFCYPSGRYTRAQAVELSRIGIVSAATAKAGFTRRGTSRLELPRFFDADNVSDLQFEAELSGFFELMRRFRNRRFSSAATVSASPS
jgi:peptidoglycan/xylan/chitin deacetylase (PgdA/CDA1 family)